MNKRKSFILAIGIDNYSDNRYSRLHNAKTDVENIVRILQEKYDFELLNTLFDKAANRKTILNELNNLATQVLPTDNLVIYYAGHGEINPRNKKGYWIPCDADDADFSSLIPNSAIIDSISGIEAKHVLLISDSCFSGTFLSQSRSSSNNTQCFHSKLDSEDSRWVISSGRSEKVSDGSVGIGSPFANSLVNILYQNSEKYISVAEIAVKLQKEVGISNNQQPLFGEIPNTNSRGGQLIFQLNDDFLKEKTENIEIPTNETVLIVKKEFQTMLDSLSVKFSVDNVDEIHLMDVFIVPDLQYISKEKKQNNYIHKNLLEITKKEYKNGIKLVILGDDLSGRTTLCKYLFTYYYDREYLPILIQATDIHSVRKDSITQLIHKNFKAQYEADESLLKDTKYKNKIVLIIDDFHKLPSQKSGAWQILIQNFVESFSNVIITGRTLIQFNINNDNKNIFQGFDLYEISEFGYKLRTKLIEKWNKLGYDETLIDKNELFRKNDNAVNYVQNIIGKNYIPAYPFYILTILQAISSGNSHNPNYSLHGFYYELIINESLAKSVKDKGDISLYYNYLTYFCYYLFEQKTKQMLVSELEEFFHQSYCQKFALNVQLTNILDTFRNAKLMAIEDGEIRIPYQYVYYFFVAKYLTNNITKPETKSIIEKICQRTYRDEYASMIMFLTHLSKDEFIIDTLLNNAKTIFSETPIAQFDKDIEKINSLVNNLPKQVVKQISAARAREEEVDDKDQLEKIEKIEKNFEEHIKYEQNYDINEDISNIDILSKITYAFKTVELLGQVAKKYWGEMTGDQKYRITAETYFLGLRTLGFYFMMVQENQNYLVKSIKEMIEKKHIKDNFNLEKSIGEAKDFLFQLYFLCAWGTIKRITNAVGYEKLNETYKTILEKNKYNSIKLINLSIKLDHYKKFPLKEIEGVKTDLEMNRLGYLLLKNLVINYLYMFEAKRELRQNICNLLDIGIKEQLVMSNSSKIKKE